MGESKKDALRVNFDKKLKLEFHGVKVTGDGCPPEKPHPMRIRDSEPMKSMKR